MTISGLLREDVTDPTGAGNPLASMPFDFLEWVHDVLAKELGGQLSALSQTQYNSLVQTLWQDEAISSAYEQYNAGVDPADPYAAIPTVAQMKSLVSDVLTSTTGKSDNPDLVQSFLSTKTNLGVSLTAAQRNFNAGAYTSVPAPFAQVPITGLRYGEVYGSELPHWAGTDKHMGTDYGTPAGTPIVAPFAGTVSIENDPDTYGTRVTLTLPDGSMLSFGHVAAGVVQGPVNPGQQIAISGANVGDSTGAVTLVEYQTPDGQFIDPATILDPIWKGTTFQDLGLGGAAGSGLTATQLAERRFGVYDPTLAVVYSPEVSLFKQYFGRDPTTAELQAITAGNPNAHQMEDIIRGMPSHIAGIGVGALADMRQATDSVFQKVYGHVSNDSNLKDIFDQSNGNPSGSFIQYYVDQLGFQPGRQVDPFVYNSVYQAALPQSMAYHNQQPDVRDLKTIWEAAGSPGEIKASDAAAMAQSSPALTVLPDAPAQPTQPKGQTQQ